MDVILFVLVVLPVAAVSQKLDLPAKVLFKLGERRELTCRLPSCPEKVKFIWTPLEDKPLFASAKTHDTESVMIFENVTKNHENTVLCKAICGKATKQAKVGIKVYSFPRNPVISGNDRMILGEENLLTCEVPHAYPPEFLKVEWLYGDTVLHHEEGKPEAEDFMSSYRFTPSSGDEGKVITCRASLGVDGIPSDEMSRETSGHLRVLSAPHNVRVSGLTAVSLGSSLTLTCEAEGRPDPAFTWTALRQDGRSVDMGKQKELFIHTVSLSDAGIYQCEVSNRLGKQTVNVSVVVQAPPTNTEIKASPQAVLKEGESVSIYCTSHGAPVERVELRRMVDGRETQLRSSAGAETSATLDSVKLADSGLYVCEAFNEFGSQTDALNLTIEAHLFEVELQPDGEVVAEIDSSLELSCRASGCPQPTFSWKSLRDTPVRGLTQTNGSLSQLLLDPLEIEDEGTYICEVTCGSVTKSTQTRMNVFSFPTSPVVEHSGSSLAGRMIDLTCSVWDVFPAHSFRVLWMDGERELHSESGPLSSQLRNLTSVLSYRMKAEDQDKRITCKVLLEMHGVPDAQAVKTALATLSLHYPPRGTRITVSPQLNLKEGESMSISCLSDSVPAGRVVLSRVMGGTETELKASDGAETSVILPYIKLDDSGLYVCEASNQYGSHRDSVEITVKAPPRNTTVEVLPSSEVQEGQNITICCNSVSFPPPAVVLRKLDSDSVIYSPDGVFNLINLTTNDTGLYQVNVTNDLGYEIEIFTINVMEKRSKFPPSWQDFVTPAVCLGAATALLGTVVYLWRETKKKGSYDLTKCNPDCV